MNHHPPSSGRRTFVAAARVSMIVVAIGLSACSRSSQSADTVSPVASTIDISEPVVVVEGDQTSDSQARLTVSEAVPGDAIQETPDEFTVADDIVTLPPEQVDELLGTAATTTTPPTVPATTAPATTVPPAAPATTVSPESPATTTAPSVVGPSRPTDTIANPTIDLDPVGPVTDDVENAPLVPLQIVKYSPEGEVQIAPYVTVTFNQPMKIASVTDANLPIAIEPVTEGTWRWLGDRTVRFEPTGTPDGRLRRFPAATLFRVTVSGAIESADGQQLGTETSWQFATPPPSIVSLVGASADANAPQQVGSRPVFVVQADQHIGADDVVAVSTLTANSIPVEIRPATNAELAADPAAADAVGAAGSQRTAAITPVEPLPPAADLTLTIGPNLASIEGELVQPASLQYFARSRSTPQVDSSECLPADCAAGSALSIVLNNALDINDQSRADLAAAITVEPRIPNLEIDVRSNRITLAGATKAGTEYTVTLGPGLRDVFGQSIAEPLTVSFRVADAHPFFDGPRSEMVILDPDADRPTLAVQTVNHDRLQVRVWAVTTRDFADYTALRTAGEGRAPEVPETWRELFDDTVAVDGPANEVVTTEIDLDDELAQAGSQLVVFVAPDPAAPEQFASQNLPLWTWVQRTALGVDAIADEATLMIWTTDLRTGEPVGGIPVALIGDSRVATTDEDGIQVIKLTEDPIAGLIANDGTTVTYLPAPSSQGWKISDATQQSRWEVMLNGTVYRPGETIRLTGWVRGLDPRADRLLITPDEETEVVYTVIDSAGREIGAGTTTTNRRGGFTAEVALPSDLSLGTGRVVLRSGTSSTTESFDVSRFLSPAFNVAVQAGGAAPYLAESPIELSAAATSSKRLPITNAAADWSVKVTPATYRPPNWATFQFGRDPASSTASPSGGDSGAEPKQFTGTTDGTGTHSIAINVDESGGFPSTVRATATVADDDGTASESDTSILVHPADQYVGIRTPSLFTEIGEPIVVNAIVSDIDGTPQSGRPVEISLLRVNSQWENGDWVRTFEKVDFCSLESTADAEMRCVFDTDTGGEYLVRASVHDESGRRSVTERTHWVSGSLALPSSPRQLEQATVVPDRDRYEPGDTARLLILAPWAPARGVVVLSRYNIEETIPFETDDGSVIVEVPITERSVPNITGWVTMIGAAPRLDANGRAVPGETRPAVASGRINLSVPATAQHLDVAVRPATTTLRPGQDTTFTVEVTDQEGVAVPDAQIALVVADEAALGASGFETPDPTEVFYADYLGQLSGISSRQYVQLLDTRLVDPNPVVAESEQAADRASEERQTAQQAASMQSTAEDRFSPLALYSTENFTDENGTAVVAFRAPDESALYRVTAVAVGPGQQFGFEETRVTAGQPLDLVPKPPSEVRIGDEVNLPVLLRNYTDERQTVAIAVEASGVELAGPAGRQVTVEPQSTVEVRFPIRGAQVGPASLRFVAVANAVANDDGDAVAADGGLRSEVSVSISVEQPATTRTFATNAILKPDLAEQTATQRIVVPNQVEPGFGGLDITVSTSVLSTASGVALELSDPITASSNRSRAYEVIAARALVDRVDRLAPDAATTREALVDAARRSFQLLTADERDDGSWSDWPREADGDPWVTVIAADAVRSGLDQEWGAVSDEAVAATMSYVGDIGAHIPDSYPVASRILTRAYAVRVLQHAGGDYANLATTRADELLGEFGADLPPDAVALIWPSLSTAERRDLAAQIITDRAIISDAGVRFDAGYTADDYPVDWSQARADATVLNALLAMAPESPLIEPTLEALVRDRAGGTWGSRAANAAVSIALRAYSDRFESSIDADQSGAQIRVQTGPTDLVNQRLSGLTTVGASVPLTELSGVDPTIVMSFTGTTRLYTDARLTYAPIAPSERPATPPDSTFTAAIDRGIVVERSYEPILDPSDVVQQPDGSWLIARGAPVRVRLVMVTDSPHSSVELADRLPVGLTPISPSLAVAQSRLGSEMSAGPNEVSGANEYARWPGWNWFDHQSLTAQTAEAVTAFLPAGSFEYIYVARATTPGRFVAPEAKARATNEPEVSGSSRAAEIVID